MTVQPRAVVVSRPSEYAELLATHGTRQQVAFFLERRGRDLDRLDDDHAALEDTLRAVAQAIPASWRRARVDRSDLDRWLFEPEDRIITVGQDGLVANVAKYLDTQAVLGVHLNGRTPGPLARLAAADVAVHLHRAADVAQLEWRTMVELRTDDGQRLRALNEIFVGHASHQSARYVIRDHTGLEERQSSSGVLVGTGTGATGWCRSIWSERNVAWPLPDPTDETLTWFVREAWPSPATGASLTAGRLASNESVELTSTTDDLVAFGDGIESDHITLRWGQTAEIGIASQRLVLV